MEYCDKFKVTINGEEKLFNSSLELDSFLSRIANDYNVDSDPTLQINRQQITEDKIKNITQNIESQAQTEVVITSDGESETILKIPGSMGVTRVMETYGLPESLNEKFVQSFDKEAYLQKEEHTLTLEGKSLDQIRTILNDRQYSWKQLTDYGDEVHKYLEHKFSGTEYTNKLLSSNDLSTLDTYYQALLNKLHARHGEDCLILTEQAIISRQVHSAYKNAGIDSINGRIDLLVIDRNGIAHIYDYKVSRKHIGGWSDLPVKRGMKTSYANERERIEDNMTTWDMDKKNRASYQLAFYRAILKQYGISVGTTGIIPIQIVPEYEDSGVIKGLKKINADIYSIVGMVTPGEKGANNRQPFTERQVRNVETILPQTTVLDSTDLVASLVEPMTKMFPSFALETQVQRATVMVDTKLNDKNFIKRVYEGDFDFNKGKYKFYYKGWQYAQNEDELRLKVQKVVDEENAERGNELIRLADQIEAVQTGNASLESLGEDNYNKRDYCVRIFRKYCDLSSGLSSAWKLIKNPDLLAAGLFVFQKEGTDIIEIVSITHNLIHQEVDLGIGKSLLGKSKRDWEIDNHRILAATNGNIDLIKVVCLINNNEALQKMKINKIASFNIWMQQGTETYLETLLDNFDTLCATYDIQNNLASKKDTIFASTLESAVITARDIAGDYLVDNIGEWTLTFSPNDIVQGVPWLLARMNELKNLDAAGGLRHALTSGEWNFDDPLQLSYMLLNKALNKLNGYNIYIERDPAKWFGVKGGLTMGNMISSPANSPSLNVQSLHKIFSVAESKIRRTELAWQKKIRKVFTDFYTFNNRSTLAGGEIDFFDNLFVRENGKITEEFRLKNPNDPSLAKEESDLITVFLEVVNNFKYKGNDRAIEEAKASGDYYKVPLAMGSTASLMHNKGMDKWASQKFHEAVNFMRLFPEQDAQFRQTKHLKPYNKYDITFETRQSLIGSYGIEGMETHLEKLLLDVIHTYTTEEVMTEFLPRMQGIKIALQYAQSMYGIIPERGNGVLGMIEYIDKYIDSNVFGKSLMGSNEQLIYKVMSTIKDVTSVTALGLNYRSGLREMMQGMWIHITRTFANAYGKNQFTYKDLTKAYGIITKEATYNIDTLTLVDALNTMYGMANADPIQVQERLRASKSGVRNFESGHLFVFNKIPDMYHRTGLLIAKMIHDGCYEAYSLVNNELVYDFAKDKRFSLLSDPTVNKESKAYKEQHSLYIAMLQQFNREGYTLYEGDALPQAYTTQESDSLKSFAEMCFGHYDKSTQMLAKQEFLGAFFLQFRTFLSAKLEQWFLKPGTYNQGQYATKYTPNGDMYVQVFEKDADGRITMRIALESEMTENDIYEPYKEWQGRFMEGIAYSMWSYIKALATMDQKTLQELWQNETKRSNLILFLEDMVWASILMFVIQLLFGMLKEDGNYSPVAHVFESSMYNSLADSNIFSVTWSMVGDLNPPSYSIIKNVWTQTANVLTGDAKITDAAINSFGVLNDLKYLENQLD